MLQYYGVTFPTETKSEVTARMEYDESGRTVKYVVYTINAKATLTAASLVNLLPQGVAGFSGDPTDTVMSVILARLSTNGAKLIFEGKGGQNLTCNDGSGVIDLDFGPKPKVLAYETIGNTAVKIAWQCDVALPPCNALYYQGVVLSLTYTQDFSTDHNGNCSRTTTGTIVIPLNRTQDGSLLGPGTLPDTADNYWEGVFNLFPIPYWCRRTTNQRYLNYGKNVLRFRIVDTQMGVNMLPVNVSDMQASQSVTPLRRPGQQSILGLYQLTFNATITMIRSVPRQQCYTAFLNWVFERVNFALAAGITLLPTHLSLEEPDVFGIGPTGRFSLTFMMLQPLSLENSGTFLTGTALWLPTSTSWEAWTQSMQSGEVGTALGSAGLKATASDETLVSLCNPDYTAATGVFRYIDIPFGPVLFQFPVAKPDAKTSWTTYENKSVKKTESGTVRHKLLPSAMQVINSVNSQAFDQYESDPTGTQTSDLTGGEYANANNTDNIQNVKSPTVRFRMIGSATRIAYDIPMPTLKTFNGTVIKPCGEPHFVTEQVGNFGYPVLRAEWDIEYDIPYSDYLNSYFSSTPDSPLPGQSINGSDDTGDSLQGDGINNGGGNSDIFK